jgi:TolB-like protein/DNA-binding winged helix-turn-helix (wHTH) protein/Flp pilus assembly protein TadD
VLKASSNEGPAAPAGGDAPVAYVFGPYRFEVPLRRLLRGDEQVPLTPKAFDVLLALIERRDRVVDKSELMKLVWADSFVEEANLSQTIFVLRKTLGLDANGHHYIDTVPRRGYRFAAPVQEIAPPSDRPHAKRWIAGVAAAVAVVALVAAGTWRVGHNRSAAATVAPNSARIVVLPLENLSADPAQDYLADGLTEEMITELSRVRPERLAVIARTSAMTYKDTKKSVAEIGQELRADYLLEGSVKRDGDRLRVSVRLVRASDQTDVWAENYERELRDVLALQGEVARAIAARIGIEVSREHQGTLDASLIGTEAYDDYLKGRFFWNKMTPDGLQTAVRYFESAVARNPNYAAAYSGLADSYANLGLWGLPGQEALTKAKAAADKAIAIRETLAEGHASRAFLAMSYELDWATAEREFKRALELNPSYAFAHHRYGYLLMLMRRWDESETELKKAQEMDPLSMIINANIGFRLYMMRRYDAAIAHWDRYVEMDPQFMLLHAYKGMAFVMKGQHADALASFERARSVSGDANQIASLGYIYGAMGRKEDAQRELSQLLALAKQQFVPAFYVALLYTGLGDKDRAFEWLEKAYQERSGYLMEVHIDPMFDPLRSDPRFQRFVEHLKVPVA